MCAWFVMLSNWWWAWRKVGGGRIPKKGNFSYFWGFHEQRELKLMIVFDSSILGGRGGNL